MKDQAVELMNSQGVGAAIEFLLAGEASLSPAGQVEVFDQVLRHAYWQMKDLPATLEIGQAGIALGEQLAGQHPDQADEIKSQVKAIHYNLASFTWPGWDEPDLEISPEQVQLGLEAACNNLELAIELKKETLPLSRAYWMVAAQQMAAGEYGNANQNFLQAEELASEAGAAGEALLARGFALLSEWLSAPGDPALESKLAENKTALLAEEHGELFAQQIEDARRVFGG